MKPLSMVYIWHQRTESHQTVVPGLHLAAEDREPSNCCPWFTVYLAAEGKRTMKSLSLVTSGGKETDLP